MKQKYEIGILEAAGFVRKTEEKDGQQEIFFVFESEAFDNLIKLSEFLEHPPIDRDLRVILPTDSNQDKEDLPDSFFELTKEEIREEYLKAKKKNEKDRTLMTREMRARDVVKVIALKKGKKWKKKKKKLKMKIKKRKKYNKARVRVRLPDGRMVQAVFWSNEKAAEMINLLKLMIEDLDKFVLVDSFGKEVNMDQPEETFKSLDLVPSALLNLRNVK